VLAVAITLLVLDLHVDAGERLSLLHQLDRQWPSLVGYVLSFSCSASSGLITALC
jgi:uncharacterized membrane protein